MGISKVEDTHFPKNRYVRLNDKLVDLSTPKIMGILNTTPDSFYDASRKTSKDAILSTVSQMIEDGADMVDIGGFSTRPDGKNISEEEEINRILTPIEWIKTEFPETILSIDTFRAKVAEIAISNGANIINDISGFQFDPEIIKIAAKNQTPYVLMHSNETFDKMHSTNLSDENLIQEMMIYFSRKIGILKDNGIVDIVIDPGFGFGKTLEQNYKIMQHLGEFNILGYPILVGLSRKSMIYKKLECLPENSLNGTTVLNTLALQAGAKILRVHDVKEAKQIIQILS